MCGRYSLTKKELRLISKLPPGELQLWFKARFNIAPTQEIPIIALENGQLAGKEMAWGLRPAWSNKPIINAQAETLLQKPSFREAFQQRRCLAPADGFFEWRKTDKTPFRFLTKDERVFCFAGIWEMSEGRPTCALVTTAANHDVAPVHTRMPLILDASQYDDWLADAGRAEEILRRGSQVELRSYPVSARVNKVANDDPGCLEKAQPSLVTGDLFS
jgi:putative SOS response-associated peptidase YedK